MIFEYDYTPPEQSVLEVPIAPPRVKAGAKVKVQGEVEGPVLDGSVVEVSDDEQGGQHLSIYVDGRQVGGLELELRLEEGCDVGVLFMPPDAEQ